MRIPVGLSLSNRQEKFCESLPNLVSLRYLGLHVWYSLVPIIRPIPINRHASRSMFQLIGTPHAQGIEEVTVELEDTPAKVHALGQAFFLAVFFTSQDSQNAEKLSFFLEF